jgi:hypothetical protein
MNNPSKNDGRHVFRLNGKNGKVTSPAWLTYELNSCNGHPNKNNILIIPEICSLS